MVLVHRTAFKMYSSLPHLVYSRNTDALWVTAALLSPGSVLEGNGASWAWPNSSHPTSLLSLWGSGTQPQCTTWPKLWGHQSLQIWHWETIVVRGNHWQIWPSAEGWHFKGTKSRLQCSISKTSSPSAPCHTPVTWVQWATLKLLKASFICVWHNGCGE